VFRYLRRVGWQRAARYAVLAPLVEAACALPWAPARAAALRLLGARIGPAAWIERVRLYNIYSNGLRNLEIGDGAYVGPGAVIDLANPVRIGARASFGPGVTILTHFDVGGPDHPLADRYHPRVDAGVEVGDGAGVSAGSLLMPGARVPAGTLVPPRKVVRAPSGGDRI
jgi:acetyltransferase-like isoleucine patch superfamily enzyme